MEAVILAAGRGQRMAGISKPFYKPLLEINGLSLLAHSANYAAAAGVRKAIVVASPQNAEDIAAALENCSIETSIVIQHDPHGPGHAALVGLSSIKSDRTLLLLSDNIMDETAVVSMIARCREEDANAVAVCDVNTAQASRFTRVRSAENGAYTYEETTPITDKDLWQNDSDIVKVWCGPLVFDTVRAIDVLGNADDTNGELKIGPHLTKIMRTPTLLVDVKAMDVGIPSAYESMTQ
jgi:bifunctional N-acetylglucosamine-1-phosphate-uridyltransferase/glucosamine-1-phosphate-acetyltransferase GlmU-like protein